MEWQKRYPELVRVFGSLLIVEDEETEAVKQYLFTLNRLPFALHARLVKAGLKQICLANKPVPELDDLQRLRGLPVDAFGKRTWDQVPGAYTQGTIALGVAGQHGSSDLLVHEWAHAAGDLLRYNQAGELTVAFLRLQRKLDPFYIRLGVARGSRELFAEGLAVCFTYGREECRLEYDEEFADYLTAILTQENEP